MLSTARSTAQRAQLVLRGTPDLPSKVVPSKLTSQARPSTALLPLRCLSSSATARASGAYHGTEVAVPADGTLARKRRAEVPLPSQEGTKGAVQYALSVPPRPPPGPER
jgi:hypothetical protein